MEHRRIELESVYEELLPYRLPPVRGMKRLMRPFRRAAKAAVSVARYGGNVSTHHSVGPGRQALMLVRLLRDGYSVEDFYRYRLYRQPPDSTALFVPAQFNYEIRGALYQRLGVDPDDLADKRRFGKIAAALGLPVAVTVADFSDGAVRWWAADSLPSSDLFAKEAQAMCGQGAMCWSWNGDRWVDEQSGANYDQPALLSHLTRLSENAPIVLQKRLSNHRELSNLSPLGLCTVRVVTLRSPLGERAEILLCAFRIPKGGDIADNFARGGLACPIAVETGILGTAVLKDLHQAHLDFERHPDTGDPVTGRQLPYWDEVIALALRAHDCFPQHPSIGWDIAITDDGPVLLEANYNWDSVLAQQAGCRPLGATSWSSNLLEWAQHARSSPPRSGQHEAELVPAATR